MKIHIAYKTTNSPWGGGNQFISFLAKEFEKLNLLSEVQDSDIVLFNSHQNAQDIIDLKRNYPNKKFVHRIDGPMRLYNKMSDDRDDIVYFLNGSVADASVFQSAYSLDANMQLGFSSDKPYCVIYNDADPSVFFPKSSPPKKFRIISTSYSSNIKKGFDTYKFLDSELDFSNLEYVFAGNSPFVFKNIKTIGCLNSNQLSNELRNSSIYLTASQKDPCSNSLIEAISTHTPVIALKDGGHPEIVGNSGELYTNEKELPRLIQSILGRLNSFEFPKKVKCVNKYIDFFQTLLDER